MGGDGEKGKGKGGFGGGFGKDGKGKGKGKKGKGKGKREEKEWVPCTKLGRLVKEGRITSIEDIYLHSLPIKEYQIVDTIFSAGQLKDDVMKIMPVQKQTSAGQRNRFKIMVGIGDSAGHVGLGHKSAKEVATAIRGALVDAKMQLIPVRRGYWGNKIGNPHTVALKVTGKCGSIRVRLIPAPRGTGVVGSPATKRMLQFAGISDCFSSSRGHTKCRCNFLKAVFACMKATYGFLTPDMWKQTHFVKGPFQEWSDYLAHQKPKYVSAE